MPEPAIQNTNLENVLIGGRYQVHQCIGEGAMGSVYRAEDLQLRRIVALKVLRKEWLQRPEVRERLEHECRIMAHIGPHPNIVTLFDRLEYDGNAILVLEFIKGQPLDEVISRAREINTVDAGKRATRVVAAPTQDITLTEKVVIEIIQQCLNALDFSHGKGIVHRDVKPGNIMVSMDNTGKIQAKLMDFGIAKMIGGENDEEENKLPTLTMVGGAGPGTPAYMAPEQIDSERFGQLGPHSDLYALGITLFEALTLKLPFEGTLTELLHAHTNTEAPDPAVLTKAVSPDTTMLIRKALRKNPEERYISAAEFNADLQSLGLGGGTMVTGTGTPIKKTKHQTWQGSPSTQPGKSKTKIVTMVMMILVLAVVVVAGYFLMQQQAKSSPSTAETTVERVSPAPDTSLPTPPTETSPANATAHAARTGAEVARDNAQQKLGAKANENRVYSEAEQYWMAGEQALAKEQYEDAAKAYSLAQTTYESVELKKEPPEETTLARKAAQDAEAEARERFREADPTTNGNFTGAQNELDQGNRAFENGDYNMAKRHFDQAKDYFAMAAPPPPPPQVITPEPVVEVKRTEPSPPTPAPQTPAKPSADAAIKAAEGARAEASSAQARANERFKGRVLEDNSTYKEIILLRDAAERLMEQKKYDDATRQYQEFSNKLDALQPPPAIVGL